MKLLLLTQLFLSMSVHSVDSAPDPCRWQSVWCRKFGVNADSDPVAAHATSAPVEVLSDDSFSLVVKDADSKNAATSFEELDMWFKALVAYRKAQSLEAERAAEIAARCGGDTTPTPSSKWPWRSSDIRDGLRKRRQARKWNDPRDPNGCPPPKRPRRIILGRFGQNADSSSSSSEEEEEEIQVLHQNINQPQGPEVEIVHEHINLVPNVEHIDLAAPAWVDLTGPEFDTTGSDLEEVPIDEDARAAPPPEVPTPPLEELALHPECCDACEIVDGQMVCDCDPESECHQVDLEDPSEPWGKGSGKYADRKARHKKYWDRRREKGDDVPRRHDDNNNHRRGGGGGGLGGVSLTCTPSHSRARSRRAPRRHYGLRKRAAGQYTCVPRYPRKYRYPIRRPRTVVDHKIASM